MEELFKVVEPFYSGKLRPKNQWDRLRKGIQQHSFTTQVDQHFSFPLTHLNKTALPP